MGTSTANVVEILALLILLQSVSSFCNGDNFNGSCIKTEREALVKFKSSLLNNSNSLPSWVGDDCCRWDGVTCDDINGHVVELVLSWASIMGNISLHLGNLSNLQYLDLSMKPSLAIHSLHFPSSLKYLNLSYVLLDKCDNWLQSINMLPSLLELDLWNCELSIIADVSHVNFTSLEVLNLGWNNFHSTIPRWLYNITKLQNLVLHSGPFRGSLSTDISNLKSLASLDADFNSLEGNIPNTLNRLCNLIELYLGYNKFSGEISGTFGNSSGCIKNSLENLYLLNNSFSGSIPDNLGQFKRLKFLSLSKNSFWGSIPVSIGQLYNLETLNFSKNSLHGKVSELHLLNLRSLIELSMGGNSLVFDIDPEWIPPFQLSSIDLSSCEVGPSFPQWLRTQKSIRFLEMSNASISDNIPDWFENISSNIVSLDLSYNQLFGTLPTFRKLNITYANEYRIILLKSNQFDGFLTCSHFDATILDISNNLLHGQIPQNLSEMMPSLQLLSLSNNYLNGTVPATLCRSGSLQILDLSNNHLSGRIPSCWGNLPSLTVIDFSSNMLSGDVPMSLGSQESLVSLHLQNNTLQGKIPMSLRNLESLETLDFSMNAFDGFIPSWIGESLSSLKVLSIHSNKFEASYGENVQVYVKGIELEYTRTLRFLYSIDLSGNNFVGEIPQELMNLSGLQILNLSTNKLDGHIPWNIGKLSSLESLDLSENELSGSIPFSISDLNFLSHLNLSLNHLSGRIPKGNQLQTLDDKSIYIGNDGLCGPPLNNCSDDADELPKGHEKGGTRRKDDSEIVWFYGGMGMGFAAGFVGVCSILYFNDSRRCAWFGLVDRVYNKLWVTIAIKANQVKRKFLRNKLEGNA
ncbi:receptor-like protein EIX2 isoform X2 [Manihot esculenta]|uniref:receptor-like protein EIX2 isoform X2 n=1 Tax=Manihot esculenta TaxID=3983 RepID=UPI000B5D1774|nr:receptor-like protein EIX2 isoform X2 [Manihot esculenta]